MIILYIAIVLLFILVSISIILINNLISNKLKTEEHLNNYYKKTFTKQWNEKIDKWYQKKEKEFYFIKSIHGYELSACEMIKDKKKFVICLHGVTTNKEFARKFSYMYDLLGYSVLTYDSTAHGKSGGKYITYGYYEKDDLQAAIHYLRDKYGKDIIIGLHGESMGAGVLLTYAALIEDGCQFYIADCSYSNIFNQAKAGIKDVLKLPEFMNRFIVNFAFFLLKTFKGIDLKSLNIKENIKKVNSPILFLDAKDDDFINPVMTTDLFNHCTGDNKEFHWFETGFHAGSFNYQPEEYIETTRKFLEKYVVS